MKVKRIVIAICVGIAILTCGVVIYELDNQSIAIGIIGMSKNNSKTDSVSAMNDSNTAIESLNQYEYLVNSNGQTYGSSQYANSIESLPELIHCGSVNGVNVYIYAKDILEAMPKTPKDAQDDNYLATIFTTYEEDGKTIIGGEDYYFGIQFLPATVRSEYAIPPYPLNENGQTYGTMARVGPYNPVGPDLVAALGIDGTEGFVYQTDLDEDKPNNPEEAIEYMKRLEEMRMSGEKYVRIIPLYANNGETIIGEFGLVL